MFQVFNLCFVKHWILTCQSLIEKQEERTTWSPPPRQWQQWKFVILFKSLLHPYLETNIGIYLFSKQMYIILGYSKSIDLTNFAAVNNRTINNIHNLLVYCRKNWPKETIPPNLHMLEDHTADFLETWSSPDHDVYGEHGAESIHKIIRLLQSTYWSMQPAMICLQEYAKRTL